jgi:flagellar L-ring protein precursor FlgH
MLTPTRLAAAAVSALLLTAAAEAAGPSSSLFGNPGRRQPLLLAEYSWTYPKEMDEIRLNALITVIVDEKTAVTSQGEMDRKKKAYGDLILKNWVLLKGLAAIPDPQSLGSPHIRGEVDNKMRSEADLQTRDTMKFRISCRVVDIRPNGNLVIEGRRTVRNNLEVWEQSLTGEVRPKDVLPNNTVLSENVAELRIEKRESGHVRDGYRRGWMLQWLDKWQPF